MSLKDLRQKIKSIKSTAKLTQAMQMVAAAKMNKAINATLASRAYSDTAWAVAWDLIGRQDLIHPLFQKSNQRSADQTIIISFTSNRGLAGSFNTTVIRKVLENLTSQTKIVTIGKKGKEYFARFHPDKLLAHFEAPETYVNISLAQELFRFVSDQYTGGNASRIIVIYNRFVSVVKQNINSEQILPIKVENQVLPGHTNEFSIEPNPQTVLNILIPRIIISRFVQITLESIASEQAARMVAMKNATDNAKDIAADLTLIYQGLRQASITREIIEISAGANAL